MARSLVTLTTSWQAVATKQAVFSGTEGSYGKHVEFNDTNLDDSLSMKINMDVDTQVQQTEAKTTYARCQDANGVKIIVDETA